MTLEQRLDNLERSNRNMRAGLVMCILVGIALFTLALGLVNVQIIATGVLLLLFLCFAAQTAVLVANRL